MQVNFEKVSFSYNKNTPYESQILKDFDLNIKSGLFTAIIGKTGSGKSTLIEHINGLLLADGGLVKVDDYVLEVKKKRRDRKKLEKDLFKLREDVSILFQFSEQQLFESSVLKDIIYAPMNYGFSYEEASKRAEHLLDLVGLNSSYMDRSPFELSGGEMRKVALCGVLAIKPKLLVLDEATIGLDFKSKQDFMKIIKKIQEEEEVTIVFVTHNMEYVLEYADDIVILQNGKLVFHSSDKEEFLNQIRDNNYNLRIPEIISFQDSLKEKGVTLSKLHYTYEALRDELLKKVEAVYEQ